VHLGLAQLLSAGDFATPKLVLKTAPHSQAVGKSIDELIGFRLHRVTSLQDLYEGCFRRMQMRKNLVRVFHAQTVD